MASSSGSPGRWSALPRLPPRKLDFDRAQAFIWQVEPECFFSFANINRVPLSLLKGIDGMRDLLFDNTMCFALGLPANNALVWAARGMVKVPSSRRCMPP